MGVSGCGKSTVAEGIAAALGLACMDGDHLHTPDSVAKMKGGTPLTDDDRWPWLDRIGAYLRDAPVCGPVSGRVSGPISASVSVPVAAGGTASTGPPAQTGAVISCSALKRAYRDRLRAAVPGLRFIFLDGSAAVIRARMLARQDHYMPAGLLDSQLNTLQRPGADEPDVTAVNIDQPADAVVASAVAALATAQAPSSAPAWAADRGPTGSPLKETKT